MNSVLHELIGKKVSVYSNNGVTAPPADIGILEAVDQQWVRLRKSETEVLYFSLSQVRLVKPFAP